jgi:hypothetical protein
MFSKSSAFFFASCTPELSCTSKCPCDSADLTDVLLAHAEAFFSMSAAVWIESDMVKRAMRSTPEATMFRTKWQEQ